MTEHRTSPYLFSKKNKGKIDSYTHKCHRLNFVLPSIIIFILVITVIYLGLNNSSRVLATTYTPPSSIPADCSSDATAALNSWFASLPSSVTINFPTNACYLVSNSLSELLVIQSTSGLIINGNNTTFKQTSYDGGMCGSNNVQPVLGIQENTNLTINNITVTGPANCSGASNEGDYGIMVGSEPTGNTNVTLNSVTIQNVDGDGLAVYPDTAIDQGINTNITYQNGTFTNIGYHGVTPEGVNGLNITNNYFSGIGNFMDLEVDNACTYSGPTSGCYGSNGIPVGSAQWNVSIVGNKFVNGRGGLWVESEQADCIPQNNLTMENNTMDSTVALNIVLTGSGLSSCPTDNNVIISNNTSTAPAGSPCGGSIAQPPACAAIEVSSYSNVTIQNNNFRLNDGLPYYYPNTPYIPGIALGAVTTANVTQNSMDGAWDAVGTVGLQFPPASSANSGVTNCNDTYWLITTVAPTGGTAPTPDPKYDASCPLPPAPISNPISTTSSPSITSTTTAPTSAQSPKTPSSVHGATKVNSPTISTSSTSNNNHPSGTINNIVGSTHIAPLLHSLKTFHPKGAKLLVYGFTIGGLALITVIIIFMVWSKRWKPFGLLHNLLHQHPLSTSVLAANSPQNQSSINALEQPLSAKTSRPGDVVRPDNNLHSH